MWSNSTVEMMSAAMTNTLALVPQRKSVQKAARLEIWAVRSYHSAREIPAVDRGWLTFCDVLYVSLISKTSEPHISAVDMRPQISRLPAESRPELETLRGIPMAIYPAQARVGSGDTDCVNFHVGEFGSPSTIFYALGEDGFLATLCVWTLESSGAERGLCTGWSRGNL